MNRYFNVRIIVRKDGNERVMNKELRVIPSIGWTLRVPLYGYCVVKDVVIDIGDPEREVTVVVEHMNY